jgi:DNA-binding XRE family transcriptional regulator
MLRMPNCLVYFTFWRALALVRLRVRLTEGNGMELLDLGREIAAHRKAQKLTQAELARRAHISRATVTALETGAQRELGFTKIAALLGVLCLDLRLTTANKGRPTLEDLQAERLND